MTLEESEQEWRTRTAKQMQHKVEQKLLAESREKREERTAAVREEITDREEYDLFNFVPETFESYFDPMLIEEEDSDVSEDYENWN